ncbi:MAG TPA: DUF4230 domain-containing protein [Bdellovibrionota bacterium]|nr:DUF4230 domain-containing protein [Bdellovibrionota bacterium]
MTPAGSAKLNALFFLCGVVAALSVALYLRLPSRTPREPQVARLDAVQQVKNILKLGVIEARVSQIYEVRRENLKIQQLPVPWTGQRSVIATKGTAQIGYNLEKAEIISDLASKKVEAKLPEPEILSIDLDFHFLQEEDTFLRRLTPGDRNKILEAVKIEVRRDLLSPELKSGVEKRAQELMTDFATVYGLQIQLKKLTPPS